MTVKQCLCKHKIRPEMLVYRHFCGGTIIGLVVRVNDRSVRIRKLNDARTCVSHDEVTLEFKPSHSDNRHVTPVDDKNITCWCVTDIHELTPEIAQEKYFRDMLLGCNTYIMRKIGWTERMSVPPGATQIPTAKQIDELVDSSLSSLVPRHDRQPSKQHTVTEFINAGKYRGMDDDKLQRMLRADLEFATGAAGALHINRVSKRQLDMLWALAWKHADGHTNKLVSTWVCSHTDTNRLHDVVYWYDELLQLVKWP